MPRFCMMGGQQELITMLRHPSAELQNSVRAFGTHATFHVLRGCGPGSFKGHVVMVYMHTCPPWCFKWWRCVLKLWTIKSACHMGRNSSGLSRSRSQSRHVDEAIFALTRGVGLNYRLNCVYTICVTDCPTTQKSTRTPSNMVGFPDLLGYW